MDDEQFATDYLESISTARESIEAVEAKVGEIYGAERREFSLTQVATYLEGVAVLRDALGVLEKNLVEAVRRERHREEFVPLPNGGAMQLEFVAGGKSWKHDQIKPVVIQAIVDHFTDEDGELTAEPEELLRELISTAGISYWKSGDLDRYDIDANDYSTKKPSRFKYKVHRND
jgi:hypothetical protein